MANNRNDRKEQRRQDAAERQAAWDGLSDDDKLARVAERTGMTDVSATNEARKIKGKA